MDYLENMLNHNKILSEYACPDSDAVYLHENKEDFRTPRVLQLPTKLT